MMPLQPDPLDDALRAALGGVLAAAGWTFTESL